MLTCYIVVIRRPRVPLFLFELVCSWGKSCLVVSVA
jgi:hypothetical protein